jgi:hypothetical protein
LDASVSAGERLAAFSLASFANRELRAWPGTRVAATRAGLSRSQYLAARDGLVRRGLIVVEAAGGGRGNSPVIALSYAERGPWFEGKTNASLFEAVLGYSRTRGSARLLLASLAALADEELLVEGVSTDTLRLAAGIADSTYRRARAAVLASGEVSLATAGGGRARTNAWLLSDPRSGAAGALIAPQGRVAPSAGTRPLVASVSGSTVEAAVPAEVASANSPGSSGESIDNPAHARTVSTVNGPGSTGVSARNPAQPRTVGSGNPAGYPARNPAAQRARGKGTQNQTTCPPSPPAGGRCADSVTIVEDYVTDRGRERRRSVLVSLEEARAQLREPDADTYQCWQRFRDELRRIVGESTFEIWLERLDPVAIGLRDELVLAAPATTRSWVSARFAGVLDRAGRAVECTWRLADERELQLIDALALRTTSHLHDQTTHSRKEAV